MAPSNVILGMIAALTVTLIVLTVPKTRHSVSSFLSETFTHQPERITELYFTNIQQIPSAYSVTNGLKVPFTIHNLEHRDMVYRYRVYSADFVTAAGTIKTIKLGNNKTAKVNEVLPPADYGQRAKVIVDLIDQQESIHFWVERQL